MRGLNLVFILSAAACSGSCGAGCGSGSSVVKTDAVVGAAMVDGSPAAAPVVAFPGAEGPGALATGGRGGRVIVVRNLATSGAGSLQDALSQSGPRIIVFAVSGVIPGSVGIEHGDFT